MQQNPLMVLFTFCVCEGEKNHGGRNKHGRITCRHRGGGHRKKVRQVDFQRMTGAAGVVERLEYDPGRTAYIALVKYPEGEGGGGQWEPGRILWYGAGGHL